MLTEHVLPVDPDVTSDVSFCSRTCLGGWPEGRPCHRYLLRRTWDPDGPVLAVLGMNPSAADKAVDDATVRRVFLLSRRRGFGSLLMLNAYGLRATDRRDLARTVDPVGFENDATISAHVGAADLVLVAWGCIKPERDRALRALLRTAVPDPERIVCYGLTKQGFPCHPLYQPANPRLITFPQLRTPMG